MFYGFQFSVFMKSLHLYLFLMPFPRLFSLYFVLFQCIHLGFVLLFILFYYCLLEGILFSNKKQKEMDLCEGKVGRNWVEGGETVIKWAVGIVVEWSIKDKKTEAIWSSWCCGIEARTAHILDMHSTFELPYQPSKIKMK